MWEALWDHICRIRELPFPGSTLTLLRHCWDALWLQKLPGKLRWRDDVINVENKLWDTSLRVTASRTHDTLIIFAHTAKDELQIFGRRILMPVNISFIYPQQKLATLFASIPKDNIHPTRISSASLWSLSPNFQARKARTFVLGRMHPCNRAQQPKTSLQRQ